MYKPDEIRRAYVNDGYVVIGYGIIHEPIMFFDVRYNDIFKYFTKSYILRHNFGKHVKEHRIKLIDQYELSRIKLKESEDSFIDHVNGLL